MSTARWMSSASLITLLFAHRMPRDQARAATGLLAAMIAACTPAVAWRPLPASRPNRGNCRQSGNDTASSGCSTSSRAAPGTDPTSVRRRRLIETKHRSPRDLAQHLLGEQHQIPDFFLKSESFCMADPSCRVLLFDGPKLLVKRGKQRHRALPKQSQNGSVSFVRLLPTPGSYPGGWQAHAAPSITPSSARQRHSRAARFRCIRDLQRNTVRLRPPHRHLRLRA